MISEKNDLETPLFPTTEDVIKATEDNPREVIMAWLQWVIGSAAIICVAMMFLMYIGVGILVFLHMFRFIE